MKQKKTTFVAKEAHFMQYKVQNLSKSVNCVLRLTTSKSITNRLLIIQALCDTPFEIFNPSSSKDSEAMKNALQQNDLLVDIGPAGTAMRFLTAYFALGKNEHLLTGSERMQNRPIEKLVTALNALGAHIEYKQKQGYPPLLIQPGQMKGGSITIDGSISSQYITALLLIAPALPEGLTLQIENKLVSEAYVELTLNLMNYMGIEYQWEKNSIIIPSQKYIGKNIRVEADWSSASYWYEIAAFTENAEIQIHGLNKKSLQGDAVVAGLFEQLGVHTTYEQDSIRIKRSGKIAKQLNFNFSRCPDLVQTMAVTCAMLHVPFMFTGTETLRIKETDRISALQTELQKLGYVIESPADGVLCWNGKRTTEQKSLLIETYEDHRMAMAFAPVALLRKDITIQDPGVVSKSYPEYWDHLAKAGFDLTTN